MDINRALQRQALQIQSSNTPRRWEDVAPNDQRYLLEFLQARAGRSENTYRRYQRELGRLAAFLRKDFSQVTAADLRDFQNFLLHPPTTFFVSGTPLAPMTERSVDDTFQVVSAFFGWLFHEGVIDRNPARNVRRLSTEDDSPNDGRYFDDAKWKALWGLLDEYQDDLHDGNFAARLRYVIAIQYGLALRVSELGTHRLSDLWRSGSGYRVKILGKGRKLRTLDVPEFTLSEIHRYRQHLGLPTSTQYDFEPLPFLPRIHPVTIRKRPPGVVYANTGISAGAWQTVFSELIMRLYRQCHGKNDNDPVENDNAWQQEWRFLTPHSLRHTRLSHLAQQGMNLLELQRFAGHTKADTTAGYYHLEVDRSPAKL